MYWVVHFSCICSETYVNEHAKPWPTQMLIGCAHRCQLTINRKLMLSFAVPRKVHLQSMGCCLLASLVPASGWGELVTSPFNYWDPTVIISQAGDSHSLPRALWDSSTFCVGSQKKPHSPNQQSSSSPSIVCWWDNQLQAAPELPELLWAIGRGCFFHSVADSVELLRAFYLLYFLGLFVSVLLLIL